MANLTNKQKEIIHDNLQAFVNNFGEIDIRRAEVGSGFYVYYPIDSDSYIQYCYNIHYLDGWLYGVVQGAVRGEFKPYRTGGKK